MKEIPTVTNSTGILDWPGSNSKNLRDKLYDSGISEKALIKIFTQAGIPHETAKELASTAIAEKVKQEAVQSRNDHNQRLVFQVEGFIRRESFRQQIGVAIPHEQEVIFHRALFRLLQDVTDPTVTLEIRPDNPLYLALEEAGYPEAVIRMLADFMITLDLRLQASPSMKVEKDAGILGAFDRRRSVGLAY